MSEIISQDGLRRLVNEWLAQGKRVAGPARVKPDRVLYAPLQSAGELLLEDGFFRPANSIKEFLFPKHEQLYAYRLVGNRVELSDIEEPAPEQVIIALPCDAAALPVLDRVFNWDFEDEFYNRRRRAAAVVAVACASHDESCFCTSVGCGPADTAGADVLLLRIAGGYEVRCLTGKGKALFAGRTGTSDLTAVEPHGPDRKFDAAAIGEFARAHFEDPVWREHALACLGCGACAFTCPTCHCFDIADEGNANGGVRVKNWDTCQFPLFTAHASGHNPRAGQGARQRQRIYHKFYIYPEKFGPFLCTGCGNCARNCPVGLGVLGLVTGIEHEQHL